MNPIFLVILRKSFKDFFTEQARDGDAKALLQKMDALETVRDRGPQNRRPGLSNLLKFQCIVIFKG